MDATGAHKEIRSHIIKRSAGIVHMERVERTQYLVSDTFSGGGRRYKRGREEMGARAEQWVEEVRQFKANGFRNRLCDS